MKEGQGRELQPVSVRKLYPLAGAVLVAERLQNSQVMGSARAFLLAYTSRSNPFFPGIIDGTVRSISTTDLVSKTRRKTRKFLHLLHRGFVPRFPLTPSGFPTKPARS